MSLTTIFDFIISIKALRKAIEAFIVYWTKLNIDRMREENRLALRKALDEKDQRDLEKALGSPKAGLPSGNEGSIILDPNELPGVILHNAKEKRD